MSEPASQLMRLIDGFVTTQLLYVAAKLGVADLLDHGPRSSDEIADAVGAQRGPMRRVLRGLAIEHVVVEDPDGRYSLTPIGRSLIALRGAALVRGELYYRSAAGLLDAVVHGGTPFELVHQEPFFEHLERNPESAAVFQASMAGRAEREARDVVAAYDFGGLHRLVDVGGGRGVLLAAILDAVPDLRGVLIDRERAVVEARAHLDAAGVGGRAECVVGDFFTSVPAGADAYLLSRVLHDWDDTDARRILSVCRGAMRSESRLLVVEAILPERAEAGPEVVRMDLHMLLLLGARERSEEEFRVLLRAGGFDVQRLEMTASPAGLGVIEATPI